MAPKITGIHHVAINCRSVEEFDRALCFYRDVLGLRVAYTWGEGRGSAAMLDTGAGMLELFASAEDDPKTGAILHIALCAEDTDACIKAVRDAGYEVTMEPTDVVVGTQPSCPARIAFCIGEAGEIVEFFHVK